MGDPDCHLIYSCFASFYLKIPCLPQDDFFTAVKVDLPKCDLLIVMGTSLHVEEFAEMVDQVGHF